MRIVDRYLVKGFLMALAYCLVLFSVLFVLIDSFNNLDDFLKHGVTLRIVLSYYLCLLPSVWTQIVPVATLVALCFTLGNLNRHNEITALKASGVSTVHILLPYLFSGVLLSFTILLLNEAVVPQSMLNSSAIMQGLILKGKEDLSQRSIKNVTLKTANRRIIFAREYEVSTETLHDVVILEENKGQFLKSKIVAKKASYANGRWTFYDTMKYHLNRVGDIVGDPVFSRETTLVLPETPEDFVKEAGQVEFMNSRELRAMIEQFKGQSRKLVRRLWVDYHFKIAFPFVSLVIILIGAPIAMKIQRGKAMMGMGASLGIVFIYYAFDSISLALGKGGFLPAFVAAWLPNICFTGLGVYFIKKST